MSGDAVAGIVVGVVLGVALIATFHRDETQDCGYQRPGRYT